MQNIVLEAIGKFNPSFVAVFGSYATQNQTSESDLDLLVEFEKDVNLLDLIGLEQELTERLGVPVDLITRRSLSPYMRPTVEKEMIRIA